MSHKFDVVVVGLGGMGSAALYHLARSGVNVLGIDQYIPPHPYGSSHGETRVIREAYFEHPVYVPLVQRAYELWAQLGKESGRQLYLKTGGLMIGSATSTVLSGSIRSALEHRLPHRVLSAAEIRLSYPGLNPDDEMSGVLEPRAGIVFPEQCVEAHLEGATRYGAEIHTGEEVLEWKSEANSASVRTKMGTYSANQLVLTTGPWLSRLTESLRLPLQIERQVLLWFQTVEADYELYRPERFPIHLWEYEPEKMFYGFPDLGDGLKIALHHQGEITSPPFADRNIRETDIAAIRQLMVRYLPSAAHYDLLRGTVCLYTNTPDGHFILDRHPDYPNVIIGSPCSGHGFKFASAVGELLSNMAQEQTIPFDMSLFSLGRF